MFPTGGFVKFIRHSLLAALLLQFAGCFSSERDNLQDPANTPILQLGDVSFDSSDGSVSVSWSYIGQGAISEFRVQRRISGSYEDVGFLPGVPGGRLERKTLTFVDQVLPAGERLFYRILVPIDGAPETYTAARSVTVPGARLESLTPNATDGSVRVSWRASDDVTGIEVYRLRDGVETLIFETANTRVRAYVDEGLQGDVAYTYYVRSQLERFSLTSVAGTASFYTSQGTTLAGVRSSATAKSFLVIPKLTSSSTTVHVYNHGASATIEQRYSASRFGSGGLTPSRSGPQPREDRELVPTTLSVDTPGREFRVSSPADGGQTLPVELFVSGLSTASDDVVLKAHTFSSQAALSREWARDGASRTCLSADFFTGTIYLAAGHRLYVLDSEFTPAIELDLPDEPTCIEASNTVLWMTADSPGRLLRGELALSDRIPTGVTWTEVPLPPGSHPTALSSNRTGQLFVLDVGLHRVFVVTPEGEIGLHWDLPNESFDQGDIAMTTLNVFVLDNAGSVHTYRP